MDVNARTETRRTIRLSLILLLLFLLLSAMYNTLSVFVGVFTFAIIFSVSFHGLFEKLRPRAGRFKKLPAIVYGLLMISVIAVPFIFLIGKLGDVLRNVLKVFGEIQQGHVPALPGFIRNLPILGDRAATIWTQLEKDPAGTIGAYHEQIRNVLQHLIGGGTGIIGTGF
jgi:predicted PurR-regulated permease PerM